MGRDDRAVIVGYTGCGKTTLSRHLIEDADKPYSIVYDAKISDAIGKWTDTQTIYHSLPDAKSATEKRIIYRPSYKEERDPIAQDEFFEWVYFRYRTRLYIDEAYAVLGGTRPSFHLGACITRGRERGISTLVSCQRPHNIPAIFLTEAQHYYIFGLKGQTDREKMEYLTDEQVTTEMQLDLKQYEFWYYNQFTGIYPHKLKLKI